MLNMYRIIRSVDSNWPRRWETVYDHLTAEQCMLLLREVRLQCGWRNRTVRVQCERSQVSWDATEWLFSAAIELQFADKVRAM